VKKSRHGKTVKGKKQEPHEGKRADRAPIIIRELDGGTRFSKGGRKAGNAGPSGRGEKNLKKGTKQHTKVKRRRSVSHSLVQQEGLGRGKQTS